MSSGQIPRTPEHFPRMKYRARKRHEREAALLALPAVLITVGADLSKMTESFDRLQAGIARWMDELRRARLTWPTFSVDDPALRLRGRT